jgi:pimeloyl-ACP methyl ester carboxylesterase
MNSACKKSIDLFVRMIPKGTFAGQGTLDPAKIRTAPTIFYIYGGPAFSPEWYTLAYNWDYENPDNNVGKANSLQALNKYFNIVVMDERGGPSNSAPLDWSNPGNIDLVSVTQLFNPRTLAFDQTSVIDWYINNGWVDAKNYFVLGHSFGGVVAWSYIKLTELGLVTHSPKGIVIASGNEPFGDMTKQWLSTKTNLEIYSQRVQDWSLNAQNGKSMPFAQLMLNLRSRFLKMQKDPDAVYVFYGFESLSLHNEKAIYEAAESLWNDLNDSTKNPEDVYQGFWSANYNPANVLNHLMSYEGLLGVQVDVAQVLAGGLKQPWMLNPFPTYPIEESWDLPWLNEVPDKYYHTPRHYQLTVADVRSFLKKDIPLALQWGRWDTIVSSPEEHWRDVKMIGNKTLEKRVTVTDGTHRDIHLEETFKKVFATIGVYLGN